MVKETGRPTTAETWVLLNPAAGGGRGARLWPRVAGRFSAFGPLQERRSEGPGHLARLAREALLAGARRVLVVGGDGSISEAVNGFFEDGRVLRPGAALGALPMGSGSDFLKTFGIRTPEQAIEGLLRDRTTACDVGEVRYRDAAGGEGTRLFLNIVSFGCGGEVMTRVNRSPKTLGPTLTYFGIALWTFFRYRAPCVRLAVDGGPPRALVITNVFVCNGRYSGSGMEWGPGASVTDGRLDLTIVRDVPKLRGILDLPKVYRGETRATAGVETLSCEGLAAEADVRVAIEVDGEAVGFLPVRFRLLPDRLPFWV